MPRFSRVLLAITFLVFAGAGAMAAGKNDIAGRAGNAEAAAKPPAAIDGFRSAKFGMTEAAVRKAIQKDFSKRDKDVSSQVNTAQRTTILTINAKDIVPDTGTAQIAYILGASAKKLIQVNVVWGYPVDPSVPVPSLAGLASSLQRYFVDNASYVPETVAINQNLPDGSVLAFRGADKAKRLVALRLIPLTLGPAGDDAKKDEDGAAKSVATLLLSYIENPEKPDVFEIGKGAF